MIRLRPQLWTTAALLLACGETAVRPSTANEEVALPAVARQKVEEVGLPVLSVAPARVLLQPEALVRFFETLRRLEEREATDDVRVLQYGDSHTAADFTTGTIRKALQARFGDGGRGFVGIGAPFKGYRQEGIKSVSTSHFESERGKHVHGHFTGDGFYGLGGVSALGFKPSGRLASEINVRTSRIELSYLQQPHGGTFDAYVDGNRVARVRTSGKALQSGYMPLTVPEGLHSLEIRPRGDGEVRFFGATLDRAQIGLVFDTLGINGARISTMREWDETHFQEQLKKRAPDLLVFAYGTNESADDAPLESYSRAWVDVLSRVRRAVPGAACLIVAPPDRAIEGPTGWATAPRVKDIVALEQQVAAAAGCGFLNTFAAMGGEGTIAHWAEEDPPRAQKDRVHYTRESYETLGQLQVTELLAAYDAWRKDAKPSAPAQERALD
jgi:hypothetical protein